MSVATLTPRVREALSVSDDYDAATIPALIRRQINRLLRDYNFPKSIVKMETLVDIGDEGKVAFELPDGFKKELLVVIYDPTTERYGDPLKRRETLTIASTSPDYYWLEGQDIVLNAPVGISGYYLIVYYQSMDAATNEDWITADFEDVLFTLSVYRGAAEFQKPELQSSFGALWVEDQKSIATYANELEFGGLDIIQHEQRGGRCFNVTGGVTAAFSPYATLVARVELLEGGTFAGSIEASEGHIRAGLYVQARDAVGGYINLTASGDPDYTGFIEFVAENGDRQGYIGFCHQLTGAIQYHSDNGGGHDFIGGRLLINSAGTHIELYGSDNPLMRARNAAGDQIGYLQWSSATGEAILEAGTKVSLAPVGVVEAFAAVGLFKVVNSLHIGDHVIIEDVGLFHNNLSTYADQAAATAAGLFPGNFYKTATGEVRIVY